MNDVIQTDIKQQFKELVRSQYKKFYKHACIQLGCKEKAKDIVQEAFLIAYEKLSTYQQKSSLETWVFGILNNRILLYFRNQQKEQKIIDIDTEKILFNKNGSWKKEWMEHSIEEQEEQNILIKFLNHCLEALKEQHKQILLMKFYLNRKTEEICEICNVSQDNVWQIIHRSKLQLKICIQSKLKKQT